MNDGFVGSFRDGNAGIPPPAPPKDYIEKYRKNQQNGNSAHVAPSRISTKASASTAGLSQKSAVERSHFLRIARMEPALQLMVGPLLRYDTVDNRGVWNGFALVVSEY